MLTPELRAELEGRLSAWETALDDAAWGRLDIYLKDVLEYNRKVNITSAKSAQEVTRRHFADSLAALAPLRRRLPERPRMLDAGAGAGFIGICLKIAWPESTMTLIESAYRKYCFLNWAAARLGMAGLRVVHGRIERDAGGGFDAVLSRALAPLARAIELTLPLASPGGLCVVWQSAPAQIGETLPYRLAGESKDRYLTMLRRTP